MLILDRKVEVCEFLRQRNNGTEPPELCATFGWTTPQGEITAALSCHHVNVRSASCDIALSRGYFPRDLFYSVMWYAFVQLKVLRLTFLIAASNLKSIALVEKLGAYREATLRDGSSDGDAYIYCLRPHLCPLWSKLHEQRQQRPTSAGPRDTG